MKTQLILITLFSILKMIDDFYKLLKIHLYFPIDFMKYNQQALVITTFLTCSTALKAESFNDIQQ